MHVKTSAAYALGSALWIAGFLLVTPLLAQQNAKPAGQAKPPQAPPAQKPQQAPAQTGAGAPGDQTVQMPEAIRLNLLIRSTLMALNHANKSGNYSVLRDLGSPAFQRFNSAAALAERFAPLRKSKADFTPIFFFQPTLVKPPALEGGKLLRLTGSIPTQPLQIDFDLAYQHSDGQWLLLGIAVGMSQARPKVSNAAPRAPNAGGGPNPGKKPAAK